MMQIITFFKTNYQLIIDILFGIITVSSIVVKFTKNTKDNKVIKAIINFLDKFSIAQTEENKKYLYYAKEMLADDDE